MQHDLEESHSSKLPYSFGENVYTILLLFYIKRLAQTEKKKRLQLDTQPSARLNLLPPLGARSGDGIEDSLGVVLASDLEQALVVGTPESVLPVGLEGIGLCGEYVSICLLGWRPKINTYLVDVGSAVGGSGTERAVDNVGQAVLGLGLGGERGIAGDRNDGDKLVNNVAEAGVDGRLGPLALREAMASRPHVADDERASVHNGLESVNDGGVVVDNILATNGPTTGEGRVASHFNLKHGVVQVVKGAVSLAGGGIPNAEGIKVIKEGLDNSLQLGEGLVDAHNRMHVESVGDGADFVVNIKAVVNKMGAVAVELADGLPVKSGIGVGGGVDIEIDAGAWGVDKGLVGSLGDDSKGGGTTSLEGPEQVRVGVGIGSLDLAIGRDDLELNSRVGKESVEVGQGAMATALHKASGDTNSLMIPVSP